jgi:hypothetical protein
LHKDVFSAFDDQRLAQDYTNTQKIAVYSLTQSIT